MQSESFLDVLIARFKDRWETNPQYRAAMSGVLGLVTLVAICACAGIISTVASSVLLASGFGPTSNGNPQSGGGGGLVQGAAVFPISTPKLPPASDTPPANPAPLSQTPQPTATAVPTPTPLPTATPCAPNCGGGGYTVTITGVSYLPNPWVQCPGTKCDSVTIHTSAPYTGVNFDITACDGSTQLSAGQFPNATTDANGNWTWSFNQTGPRDTAPKFKPDIWATAAGADPAGVHVTPSCA